MLMFDINAPRIRFTTQDSNHSNLEENFKVSDKGTHHTFERITDHASLSITFNTLCDSKEDYYYEARMRGSNNSFAVGMIIVAFYKSSFRQSLKQHFIVKILLETNKN